MKEVSKNEAMEGTWKELTPRKRANLLKRLGSKNDRFTKDISIDLVKDIDDWWKLPIPLRTFLEQTFNNGSFTVKNRDQQRKRFAKILNSAQKFEREHEDSPDGPEYL